VLSVVFSPDERWLVSTSGSGSTSGDPEILVWDTKLGKRAAKLRAFALHLTSLSFHPKSTSFACGFNKDIYLWHSQTWKNTAKLRGHTGRVNCVQFTHDGCTLLSSSEDGTIKLWDNASKTNTRTLSLPKLPVKFDGLNKLVSRWSRHRVYQMGEMPIDSVAPFPHDTRIVMCSKGTVEIWDTNHNPADHRVQLPALLDSELMCTSSNEGVYITAMALKSRLIWTGVGEVLDSNGPQWDHVRAKQYPNIVEESGWVSHTRHTQVGPRKLTWIPVDRRNRYAGALATSHSGGLFAIGSHSGLITILDVSGMVEQLAGTETR
jgi:WD40 repeat protein